MSEKNKASETDKNMRQKTTNNKTKINLMNNDADFANTLNSQSLTSLIVLSAYFSEFSLISRILSFTSSKGIIIFLGFLFQTLFQPM